MRGNSYVLKSQNNLVSVRRRLASTQSGGGGSSKLLVGTIGIAAAGVAGAGAYAAYDPQFRKKVEVSIPGSKNILNYAIGPEQYVSPKAVEPIPKAAPLQKSAEKVSLSITESSVTPKKQAVSVPNEETKLVEIKKEMIGAKDNTKKPEIKKVSAPSSPVAPVKVKNPYIGAENGHEKNEKLTDELKNRLATAEKATKVATLAKLETIRAIEHHIQTIREAIEGGKDGDWDAVTMAHLKAKRCTEKDIEVEKNARNQIADLVVEANLGAQGEMTTLNPLVPICKTTASKLSNELDEMASTVKKVDSERIFTRDYGNLVEESRKKFLLELKAVHPELDYDEGKKLKKNDLRTILAHAHLRVDQLNMKLIDMKLSEEKRVKQQIEIKKSELLEKLKLEAEENAKKNKTAVKEVVKIADFDQKKLDEELLKRTKEIEANYKKKLEEVVRTQKQLYDIEHSQDIQKAVQSERDFHALCIGKALSQLEGIENALKGHLKMDIENRKAKQMWLATQNMIEAIKYGNRAKCCMEGRRQPIGTQMQTLMKCGGADPFLKTVDNSMSRITKVKGEYTAEDLNTRFKKVCRIGRRISYVNESTGNGVLGHLFSWMKSSVTFNLPLKKGDELITPCKESNISLLNRAENLWKEGRKLDAIRVLQLTTGATRRLANDFIQDARRYEETMLLSKLLLAHSALTSIRSTY